MATTFIIPVINIPQTFDISLNGVNYILTCKWNAAVDAGWEIDIQDAITQDYLAAGVPLITGADCLVGLEYLGIGGQMIIFTDGDDFAVPTLENLGIESNLYFVTTEAA